MLRLRWLLVASLIALPARAQQQTSPASSDKPADNMDIVLEKAKADKKYLVADNMNLTESESKAFWPIYDAYQKDLAAINDRLGKTVSAYADAYNKGPIPDDTATKLTNDYLQIEQDEVNLKKTYAKKLTGVISPAKIARYLQIETKIRSAIKFDMSKNIPLVK